MKRICKNCIYYLWDGECQYIPEVTIKIFDPTRNSCEHFKGQKEQTKHIKGYRQNQFTMTNEQKQLLLKDLCARLPYGVKVRATYLSFAEDKLETQDIDLTYYNAGYLNNHWIEAKPYLRPMSSMTEEESQKELWLREYGEPSDYVDFCLEHHLDFRKSPMGLTMIERGLALEAPEGMYKTE